MDPTSNNNGSETIIGRRYKLNSVLGVGSYGKVWAAVDTKTDRLVAVKKITKLFKDVVDCKRVLREICILNRMSKHRNVVTLLDLIIDENDDLETFSDIYIVLDISDSDLRKVTKQSVFLTELHIVTLVYHILCGIYYIHSAGIYHRDLKPGNCLVNQNCIVRICDFGLARTVNEPDYVEDSDSRTGAMKRQLTSHVVTRWYRAPELILLEGSYTAKIDVWSVGCILGELLEMVEANCADWRQRAPLFPGKGCFPLSPAGKDKPDRASRRQTQTDQLSCIFDLIGTPSPEDLEIITRSDARAYVNVFPNRPPVNLRERYPATSEQLLDLLSGLLKFNWHHRYSVRDALFHPAFERIRKPHDIFEAPYKIQLPFNEWEALTEEQLRFCFISEARKFRDIQYPHSLVRHMELQRAHSHESQSSGEDNSALMEGETFHQQGKRVYGRAVKPRMVDDPLVGYPRQEKSSSVIEMHNRNKQYSVGRLPGSALPRSNEPSRQSEGSSRRSFPVHEVQNQNSLQEMPTHSHPHPQLYSDARLPKKTISASRHGYFGIVDPSYVSKSAPLITPQRVQYRTEDYSEPMHREQNINKSNVGPPTRDYRTKTAYHKGPASTNCIQVPAGSSQHISGPRIPMRRNNSISNPRDKLKEGIPGKSDFGYVPIPHTQYAPIQHHYDVKSDEILTGNGHELGTYGYCSNAGTAQLSGVVPKRNAQNRQQTDENEYYSDLRRCRNRSFAGAS